MKKNDMKFKTSTIDDEEERVKMKILILSQRNLWSISSLRRSKGEDFIQKKKSSSIKKKNKKNTNDGNMKQRAMRTPQKKSTQMCANMCFIALEDNKDKVISSSNYDELKKMLLKN